ncbi:MAG: PDZ domain-containing protein, partial [Candidatus Eiseniibacteriota bacterium]
MSRTADRDREADLLTLPGDGPRAWQRRQRRRRAWRLGILTLTVGLCILELVGSGQIFERAVLGMTASNLQVMQVTRGGPADRAGIQVGDRITAVNGVEVSDLVLARFQLRTAGVGDSLRLTVHRPASSARASGTRRTAPAAAPDRVTPP